MSLSHTHTHTHRCSFIFVRILTCITHQPWPKLNSIPTPKPQAFEDVRSSQNALTSQKCPHLASKMQIVVWAAQLTQEHKERKLFLFFTFLSLLSLLAESLRSGLLRWWWTTWRSKKMISTSNVSNRGTNKLEKKKAFFCFAYEEVNINFYFNSLHVLIIGTRLNVE